MKIPFVFGPGVVELLPLESAPEHKFKADLENCGVSKDSVRFIGRGLNFHQGFCREAVFRGRFSFRCT